MPQPPRTKAEQARFDASMSEMPRWFAHPHTIVLMMTTPLPPRTDEQIVNDLGYANTREYAARGYPYFERAVAALVKDRSEPKVYSLKHTEHLTSQCLKKRHCAVVVAPSEGAWHARKAHARAPRAPCAPRAVPPQSPA